MKVGKFRSMGIGTRKGLTPHEKLVIDKKKYRKVRLQEAIADLQLAIIHLRKAKGKSLEEFKKEAKTGYKALLGAIVKLKELGVDKL